MIIANDNQTLSLSLFLSQTRLGNKPTGPFGNPFPLLCTENETGSRDKGPEGHLKARIRFCQHFGDTGSKHSRLWAPKFSPLACSQAMVGMGHNGSIRIPEKWGVATPFVRIIDLREQLCLGQLQQPDIVYFKAFKEKVPTETMITILMQNPSIPCILLLWTLRLTGEPGITKPEAVLTFPPRRCRSESEPSPSRALSVTYKWISKAATQRETAAHTFCAS